MEKVHRDKPRIKPTVKAQETEIKISVPMRIGIKKVCHSAPVIRVNAISGYNFSTNACHSTDEKTSIQELKIFFF